MKFFLTVAAITTFMFPLSAIALDTTSGTSGFDTTSGTSRYDTTSGVSGGSATLNNPLGVNSFQELVQKLLDAAIIIGIPIAVLFIVFAGFKLVFAQGNPEALKIARKNLLYTIVGIAIFIGASLIAGVITNTLHQLGATGF